MDEKSIQDPELEVKDLPSPVSNFFEDLKDRLASPFFSSFLVSWLLLNWKIWIGLFWYTAEELKREGYDGFIDFVKKSLSLWEGFLFPLIATLLYCFAYPYLRDFIKLHNAKLKTRANSKILDATREGHIDIMSYIRIKQDFKKLSDAIEKTMSDEQKHAAKNRSLVVENANLRNEINERNQLLVVHNKENTPEILNGKWEVSQETLKSEMLPHTININNSIAYEYDPSGDLKLTFQIEDYCFNSVTRKLYFSTNAIIDDNRAGIIHWYVMNVSGDFDFLSGKRNMSDNITMRRVRVRK